MQSGKRNAVVSIFAVSILALAVSLSSGPFREKQGDEPRSVLADANPTAASLPYIQITQNPTSFPQPLPSATPSQRPASPPTSLTGSGVNSGVVSTSTPLILQPVVDQKDDELQRMIAGAIDGERGRYGVGVKNLVTGQMAVVNGNENFEAASLFKLSVMAETYRKRQDRLLNFSEELTVTEKAISFDLGVFKHSLGEPVTITKALTDMITLSDNVYANVLLERNGAWDVNQTMSSYGMDRTIINRGGLTTTVSNMLTYFDLLATGRIVDRQSSQEMIDILLRQQINDRIPYRLPVGIPVAHKTGNLDGLRHDAGIVYAPKGPYEIIVLTQDLRDDGEGAKFIAKLSRAVYEYFGNPVN